MADVREKLFVLAEDTSTTVNNPRTAQVDVQDSRRCQPARASKSIHRPTKKLKTSPSTENPVTVRSMGVVERLPRSRSYPVRPAVSGSEDSHDVMYTKTGRVSKALKGKRVHQCSFCDKVFTRAEHLKRHQLNHGDRILSCEVRGCNKEFRREDLLVRHKEEHNHGELAQNRGASVGSLESVDCHSTSSAGLEVPISSAPPTRKLSASTPFAQLHGGWDSREQAIFGSSLSVESALVGTCVDPYATAIGQDDWEFPCAKPTISIFDSPGSTYSQPTVRAPITAGAMSYSHHDSSTTSYIGDWMPKDLSVSRSPVSVSSSLPQAWHHGEDSLHYRIPSPFQPDASALHYHTVYGPAVVPHDLPSGLAPTFATDAIFGYHDAYEDITIKAEIADVLGLSSSCGSPTYSAFCQNRYTDSFWHNFHPLFPILHRPRLDAAQAPLLLRAVMMAIGAQFLKDHTAKSVARSVRDTCLKLVEKRTNAPRSSSTLWELQIVFLTEALSMYRSRRPSVHFSQRFEGLCTGLLADHDVLFAEPLEDLRHIAAQPFLSNLERMHNVREQWVDIESKRRLFLASYILETQQAIFFKTCRHSGSTDLPWPCSYSLWEAESLEQWQLLVSQELAAPSNLLDELNRAPRRNNVTYDSFQSALVVAYFTRGAVPTDYSRVCWVSSLIQQEPRTQLNHHASLLALFTPIRHLLAVSGETFVLGEKLATPDQFREAETSLRQWIGSGPSVEAVYCAAKVLQSAFQDGACGLLHEEWILYTAALVFWAWGIWSAGANLLPERAVPLAVDKEVIDLMLAAGCAQTSIEAAHAVTASRARACLLWVRSRIIGQTGGLVADAVSVLAKLAK